MTKYHALKIMVTLFGCSTDNVSFHLKNIFKERELDEKSVAEDFSVVQKEVSTCKKFLQAGKDG